MWPARSRPPGARPGAVVGAVGFPPGAHLDSTAHGMVDHRMIHGPGVKMEREICGGGLEVEAELEMVWGQGAQDGESKIEGACERVTR